MEDLLTTTDIQDALKLDRTTIYRMLKDGRLRGVKVGQQWRFPRQALDQLLSKPAHSQPTAPHACSLPIHCVQAIQDLFADLALVSVLTIKLDGQALTRPSGDRQTTPFLHQAAAEIARRPGFIPHRIDLGHGQQYEVAPIVVDGQPYALLIAGPIDGSLQTRLTQQLARLATSLESLGTERAAMVTRLNQIAALSTFTEDVPVASPT